MALHVALHHRSHYTYDRPVNLGPHLVRLRPAPHCRTPVLSYALGIQPKKHFINWQQDPFSNYVARLTFPEKITELVVEVDLVAQLSVFNPFDFFLEPTAERWPFAYEPGLLKELGPFLEVSPAAAPVRDYLATVNRSEMRSIDFLVSLNQRLSREIKYVIRLEHGVQSPAETLALRSGSCRDSTWLLVQLFRHLGLAARFVSGYLIQLRPDVASLDGPSGAASDFTDLHAWCEVFLPGAGWIGLDPTSGLLAGEGHIPLAATPEPSSAAPISGAVDPCESEFIHEMKVSRVLESPRVTKPYSERQWEKIDALGKKVDQDLLAHDVRLTMGGEPTFISIDNMDGAEWNFTAVGPEKLKLSQILIRRLKAKFAPGGFLHFGQGKWYPGEPLPRWAYSCYWRRDGRPIWGNESLLAGAVEDKKFTATDASTFITTLATRLGADAKWILPAFEDPFHQEWQERKSPGNVEPGAAGDSSRAVAGYVLPLQRAPAESANRWQSGPWFLRTKDVFLRPGDSPIGLRLPLDSLPWVSASDYPYLNEVDPSVARAPLGAPESFHPSRTAARASEKTASPKTTRAPKPGESAGWIVRTALCLEPRGGILHVFMPPVAALEDYLELLAAIEDTAAQLAMPVLLEGYPPPHDPRLNHFKVTPDPGVIEVNLHPSGTWSDLVHNTTVLYEEARQARLGAEKFMIDGRHVGTGGGNHIVVGGATPADSPFLRRPDLLRSLLGFWQNHPSLSFLFSGLFIGPTSQHPRVDEARHDSLYELEIAFAQVPKTGPVQPWLVDRLFRHLLVDLTGNTHRAEFCIDKLFSPDSSSGRLGLVELRAFEMPPHARMSLTQQLLLRALIARFWQKPYETALVRWGTSLHDRFMLPHFVAEDFFEVIDDLRAHGYALEKEWFAPHVEFRFPACGTVTQGGVSVEVRQALEPWHVLGEEGTAGGTVRYVDSSVERLQVKIRGLTQSRHLVCCNQRVIPLQPTGSHGEFVGGVRFRAWQPPGCLHPSIGVQAPLTFDIVDTWNHRSLGGCTYHVSHPGGLSYSTLPVNAFEAESRRQARFADFGHTAGKFSVRPSAPNPDFPCTLDLRHA